MAKEKEQMTMEEYLLSQLETPVKLKDGTVATKEDGSVMTKQEAIATNILNQAMNRRSSESRAKRLAA
jgi:acyl CoA:acetate/3-ketoacid CoA transferase